MRTTKRSSERDHGLLSGGDKRPGLVVCLVVAVLVLAGCTGTPTPGPSVGGATKTGATMSLLFVQTAQSGTFAPGAGTGDSELRLEGVDPATTWFSDRPQRQSGTQSTAVVTNEWAAFGFDTDPPNAALVLSDLPKAQNTVIVELRDPVYDPATRVLRYRARKLDAAKSGLESHGGHAPTAAPTSFNAASLFIDNAQVSAETRAGNDVHGTKTTTGTGSGTTLPSSAAPVTTSDASSGSTTSAACTSSLAAFTAAATAGTYTSTAQSVTFPTAVTLQNTAAPGATTASQTVSVPFVVYGTDGSAIAPSPTSPVSISIYGAPAGSIQTTPAGTGTVPIVTSVTSGSALSITYSGAYLNRPITVIATMKLPDANVCTGTPNQAIGSTSLALAVHPTALGTVTTPASTTCSGGTSGPACATANVDSNGLGLSATAGFGAVLAGDPKSSEATPPAKFANYTVDTGSIGTALPVADLGPDAVGPGAPALKYYDSSGNEFIGYVYLAPVTMQMGTTQVTTDPIRVLGVLSSACHPGKPCTKAPPFSTFHYLGVGFDRSLASTADPFQSPRDNALLSIEPTSGVMSQGYILSGGTIQVGITAGNSVAPSPAALSANTTYPGDWNGLPMCVTFPTAADPNPGPTCGAMLMDVGIPEMFITFASKADEPPAVAAGLADNQTITINAPDATTPALTETFTSGPKGGKSPPATGVAPSVVDVAVLPSSGPKVFINTGRHVLFQYQYIFNAQAGTVGFAPLNPPLRAPS